MFCGQLQSRISCLSCGNVSFCFDPFFDLSVPLPSRVAEGGGRGGDRGGGEGGGGYGETSARGSSYSSSGGGGSGSGSGAPRSATIDTTTTLEDCLRVFSTVETLDGDNRPVCARCRRRRKAQKRLAVHRFPPILVIHLKRFQYNSTSRTKLSTAVDFPIGSRLNLAPYSTPEARPSSSGSSGSSGGDDESDGNRRRQWDDSSSGSSANSGNPNSATFRTGKGSSNNASGDSGGSSSAPPAHYELYAVCNHMGGLQGGHYTAHCRSRSNLGGGGGGGASAGEWHTFDDARVGPVDTSQVGGASAYVLFYRLLSGKKAQ